MTSPSFARRTLIWRSFSQVKPIPPNNWMPLPIGDLLAVAGGGLGHRHGRAPCGIALGEHEGGVLAHRPGPLDGDVHVDGLVLDRLERSDRHTELVPFLDVLDGHVEDPLGGADRRDRPSERRLGHRALDAAGHVGTAARRRSAGDLDVVQRHVGDVHE